MRHHITADFSSPSGIIPSLKAASPHRATAVEKITQSRLTLFPGFLKKTKKPKNKLDIIITGHRKADGNYVGKGTNIFTNGAGVTRYSPLSDWPHELLLAYIHYNNIPMPPIYDWKDGYRCGTHPWPSRMGMKSIDEGWADVYSIDPSIVEAAAAKIESAAHFLKEVRS